MSVLRKIGGMVQMNSWEEKFEKVYQNNIDELEACNLKQFAWLFYAAGRDYVLDNVCKGQSKEIGSLRAEVKQLTYERNMHREAERSWEALMMELVGEDGPGSVREAINKLQTDIKSKDVEIELRKKDIHVQRDQFLESMDKVEKANKALRECKKCAHDLRSGDVYCAVIGLKIKKITEKALSTEEVSDG